MSKSHPISFDFNDTAAPALSSPLQRRFDRAACKGEIIGRILKVRRDQILDPEEPEEINWKYEL